MIAKAETSKVIFLFMLCRNYPTVTNVARKEAEQRQRIESGEILTTKEFRYWKIAGYRSKRYT